MTRGKITLENDIGSLSLKNYRIYGNSVQNITLYGEPTPTNPVEIQSVGEYDSTKGQYKIPVVTVSGKNLFNPEAEFVSIGVYKGIDITEADKDFTLKVKLKEGKTVPTGVYFGFVRYDNETAKAAAKWNVSNGVLTSSYGDGTTYAVTNFNPSDYYKSGICCYPFSKWNEFKEAFDIFLIEGNYTNENIPEYDPYVEPLTTNIYLEEPLRKIGEVADYIDFKKHKVFRKVEVVDNTGTLTLEESLKVLSTPIEETVDLPDIPIYEGNINITVNTTIAPSKIEINY